MIIGITGGIGSGKSTIAHELARRGYAVYDCDREAKRIISENQDVQSKIIALLGKEAFIKGQYNTTYVAQRVFEDPSLRKQLESIVHPAVKEDIQRLAYRLQQTATLFIESAILFEAGLDVLCKKIIVIDAPEDIRIARVINRDYHGIATEENINKVHARIQAQNPISEPPNLLHLTNDGSHSVAQLVNNIV